MQQITLSPSQLKQYLTTIDLTNHSIVFIRSKEFAKLYQSIISYFPNDIKPTLTSASVNLSNIKRVSLKQGVRIGYCKNFPWRLGTDSIEHIYARDPDCPILINLIAYNTIIKEL